MPVSTSASKLIYECLKSSGVRIVSALPETWLVHLIRMSEEDPEMTLVRLANPGYGYGGILSLDLETTERANRLMTALQNRDRFGMIAVSLGYFDTLMSVSAVSTSSELSEDELRRAGISPGLLRLSIGITGSVEQRWMQMEDALQVAGI